MKSVLFCGFGLLGKKCLERLIDNGYYVKGVLTHEELDKESVDTYSKIKKIDFSYEDVRKNNEFIRRKFCTNLDYVISVNYRYILPNFVIDLARYSINIHGSLLPKYRGRTPHVWSIINGEKESGITCHIMDYGVDTGDIIEQVAVPINDNDTGFNLLQKFYPIYPQVLIKSLNKLENSSATLKQDVSMASYFGKRTPDMGYIDFNKNSKDIINWVRAQAYPYPGAYCYDPEGKKIIVDEIVVDNSVELSDEKNIVQKLENSYYVKCNDNILRFSKIRL